MKFAIISLPETTGARSLEKFDRSGASWARFGSDLLVYSADAKWDDVADQIGRVAPGAKVSDGKVRKNGMHLVVQKGRTFQMEHPDVPVILDRGRYLVVDLRRADASKIAGRKDPCFEIAPLEENTVVYREATQERQVPSAGAAALANGVDRQVFESDLAHLVSYHTRLSTSPDYAAAADWARDRFTAMGYQAEIAPISVGSGTSGNVIATRPGTGATPGIVLVVAHLDSVNHPGGPAAVAPGADDNGSGSAGVLALAQAAAPHGFENDLVFVLFGGEEQGLHGSTQYLAGLDTATRSRIRSVLNMDMIGAVNADPPAVLLEGAALSQQMMDGLAQAAADLTTLQVQTSLNPFASDHVPFIQASIPAVLTIEGADSANDAIHTAGDTLDRVDAGFATEILKMNAGWLADAAMLSAVAQPTQPGAPGQPADCGCGCGGGAAATGASQLAEHYQALFAQYARLHRGGTIQPQDLANWQGSWAALDALNNGR